MATYATPITGRCLCGKSHYRIDAPPVFTGVCHCIDCQRQTGTSYSLVMGVPATAVHIEGPVKIYTTVGDSGKPVHRKFCSECGSPLVSEVTSTPGLLYVKGGTLDDTSILKPSVHIYTGKAMKSTTLPSSDANVALHQGAPPAH